jgi:hypothetical protein
MRPAGDDMGGQILRASAGYFPPAAPARPGPKPPDEQALLQELWQVSHFGWITEVAIRRSLTISGVHEILAVLAERLRHLLDRGWVEQRHSAAGTGQREWRLTDSGRNALSRRG